MKKIYKILSQAENHELAAYNQKKKVPLEMKVNAVKLVEIQFKKLSVPQICFWAARLPRAQPGKRLESSFPDKEKQRVSGLKNSRTRYHFLKKEEGMKN